MDFNLNRPDNGYNSLMRDYGMPDKLHGEDNSFFKKDAHGDITRFLTEYLPNYEGTKEDGYYCLITCNHDTVRPKYNLSDEELKLAYAFIFTMPGVPFLYYGDEIGMRYLDLPTKEGGYFRTGARTPMQWTKGKNAGFSTGEADALYLPVDPAADAPSVESQEAEADSLLHTVRALLALRHAEEDLQADAEFAAVYAESGKLPFVYRRGDILIAVNPSTETVTAPVDAAGRREIFSIGKGKAENREIMLEAQSFLVLK